VVGWLAVDLTEDERARALLAGLTAVPRCNASHAGEVAVVSVGWSRAFDFVRGWTRQEPFSHLRASPWPGAEAGA
jgi:formylmethanofuran dehydrogenase subunit B